MTQKPLIGIIGRAGYSDNDEHIIFTLENVRKAVIKAGGIPFLIVPTQALRYIEYNPTDIPAMTDEEKNLLYEQIDLCDGIIMPGGDKWYEYDEVACRYIIKKNMPLLGICLGMQILAKVCSNNKIIAFDNTLKMNNEDIKLHAQAEKKYAHDVFIKKNTKLAKILNTDTLKVNSNHSYYVGDASNIVINAISTDGFIEGIELPDKDFIIGLQWHPEAMVDYDEQSKIIIEAFINQSIIYHKKPKVKRSKPLVCIIARPIKTKNNKDAIAIWEIVRITINKVGAIPFILLPNQYLNYVSMKTEKIPPLSVEEENDIKAIIDSCDGLLIPGGDRIYPIDRLICKYSISKDMPILGICMGMQLLATIDNQSENGISYPNLLNETAINHCNLEEKYIHKVKITSNTKLYDILKKNIIRVNSKHNYHIPKVYKMQVSAFSEDGLIEGIEYKGKSFVIGTQWHPETMVNYDDDAKKIIDAFIKACIQNKRSS